MESEAAAVCSGASPAVWAKYGPSGRVRLQYLRIERLNKRVNSRNTRMLRIRLHGVDLTNKTQPRLRKIRPFKDGIEDVLGFAVQLIHLIQNQQTARNTQSHFNYIKPIADR